MPRFSNLESDRPTWNTLRFIRKVAPHYIQNAGLITDPYVYACLSEIYDDETLTEFQGYTRSFYSLEGHYYNLWKYDQPIYPRPEDYRLDEAIQYVSAQYQLDTPVNPISWNHLRDVPFISTSSAGWGYYGTKGSPGNQDLAIRRAVYSLNSWMEGSKSFRYSPDLAWTRKQLSVVDAPKVRHVWGKAFHNIIIEGVTAAPLIEAYRQKCKPMVIGTQLYRRLPLIIAKVLNSLDNEPLIGIGLDIKSFDSSIQPWLINEAFNIIRKNIAFTDIHTEASFEYTRYYFINTPVVMPDGRMWLKRMGVPSGSYFTQLVDSICNSILIAYLQKVIYDEFFETYVLGDDSLFGIPQSYGWPDLNKFATVLSSLHITLSPDKCVVATRSDELHFLGHRARGTRCTREDAELLLLSLYPEFPVLGPSESVARITGILLDSAYNSWPMLNLYRYMKSKFRDAGIADANFRSTDIHFFVSVVGLNFQPKFLDELKIFMVT